MPKFIKFNLVNSAAVLPLGPRESILVNIEDITKLTAEDGGPLGTNILIGLTGRNSEAGYKNVTLTVSTSVSAAVDPTLVTGKANPLLAAVRSAMTANPGGVVATAQLGSDQAAVPVQMYFRAATYN